MSIVLAIGVLLLFLEKAYTIDDLTFLLQAQHALVDPVHSTAFEMVHHGLRFRLSSELVSGPVMAYLLVPSILLDGAEWITHLIQAFLLACGAFFTSALSLRMGHTSRQAMIAALLVVASPAVLAMAATGMPDVPAMVFGVIGLERLLAAQQQRNFPAAVVGALFLVLAAMSRPHVLLLFACAALLLLDSGETPASSRGTLRKFLSPPFLCLAGGLVCCALVVFVTRDPFSGDTIAAPIRRPAENMLMFNLASFGLHWAVGFPLAVLWPLVRGSAFFNMRRTRITFALGLLVSMSGTVLRFGLVHGVIAIVVICHSFDVLADIVIYSWRHRGHGNLGLTSWLFLGAATATYSHLPEKVLVPSAPAMAILIASQIPSQIGVFSRRRVAAGLFGATIIAGLILGVLIIKADTALAEIGREGGKIVRLYRQRGERVWIDGGWGFQWYAMKNGSNVMATTPPFPTTGDVVVTGPTAYLIRRSSSERTLIYRRIYAEPGGRLFTDGAGFYENKSGPWPWVSGTGELGRIEAWRIGDGWTAQP